MPSEVPRRLLLFGQHFQDRHHLSLATRLGENDQIRQRPDLFGGDFPRSLLAAIIHKLDDERGKRIGVGKRLQRSRRCQSDARCMCRESRQNTGRRAIVGSPVTHQEHEKGGVPNPSFRGVQHGDEMRLGLLTIRHCCHQPIIVVQDLRRFRGKDDGQGDRLLAESQTKRDPISHLRVRMPQCLFQYLNLAWPCTPRDRARRAEADTVAFTFHQRQQDRHTVFEAEHADPVQCDDRVLFPLRLVGVAIRLGCRRGLDQRCFGQFVMEQGPRASRVETHVGVLACHCPLNRFDCVDINQRFDRLLANAGILVIDRRDQRLLSRLRIQLDEALRCAQTNIALAALQGGLHGSDVAAFGLGEQVLVSVVANLR